MTQTPTGVQPPDFLPKASHQNITSTAIRRIEENPPTQNPNFSGEIVYYHDLDTGNAILWVASSGGSSWVPVVTNPG